MMGRNDPTPHLVALTAVGWWLTLVTVSDLYLVPPLLPDFLNKVQIGIAHAGWIAASYQIGAALSTLPAGFLVDRMGYRFVLLLGMGLFAAGELCSALASNLSWLVSGRALVGAGSAATSLALTACIGRAVAYQQRGRTLGWIGTAYFAGVSFSPWAVTQIADRTSLTLLLISFSSLGALGFLLTTWFIPKAPLSPAPSLESRSMDADGESILRNRGFWGLSTFQMLFSAGVVAMTFYFGDWLLTQFSLDTRQRGLVFAVGGLPALLGAPLGGFLCDRLGKKPFLVTMTLALAAMTCTMPHLGGSLPAVVCLFGGVGFVAAGRYSAFHAITTRIVEERLLGRLVALRNFLTYLATAVGLLAMGKVYASSAPHGYILLGWLTTLFLVASIPVLVRWVPGEPSGTRPPLAEQTTSK